MNEHGFIRAVHAHLPPELFRWKIHDSFAGGVPDAFYAGPASSLFVEYKYVKSLPQRGNTQIRTCLTPQQKYWLDRLHDLNQPVALILGSGKLALVILAKQWNTNPTKQCFLEQAVAFEEAANWIFTVCTHGLRTHDERQARACVSNKLTADMES